MSKTVYIYIPGILSRPGAAYNWCGRAVTWTHINHPNVQAEKVEYFTRALTRPFGQKARAHKLQRVMQFYSAYDYDIHLVGHSNGCDVIVDALRAMMDDGAVTPNIRSMHLVSAACERDFDRNGLNLWIDKIGRIVIYIAEHDRALTAAGTYIGRLLGYGTLGKHGAVNNQKPVDYVRRDIGHLDWWKRNRFDATMRLITRAEQ